MGFGSSILASVEAVYKAPKARIKMNHLNSVPFLLTRGVQQGCPLSPLLFDICAEVLALAIHQDEHIRGLLCNGHEYTRA